MGNIGMYGILIVLAAFIILIILNPRISCFGRRIKSPLYPLLRKKNKSAGKKPTDYGFKLVDGSTRKPDAPVPGPDGKSEAQKKTDDYGFKLD